jgi:hypothetical protein
MSILALSTAAEGNRDHLLLAPPQADLVVPWHCNHPSRMSLPVVLCESASMPYGISYWPFLVAKEDAVTKFQQL